MEIIKINQIADKIHKKGRDKIPKKGLDRIHKKGQDKMVFMAVKVGKINLIASNYIKLKVTTECLHQTFII